MRIQVFGEKRGLGPLEKTRALVSEVWAEARMEMSRLLRLQEKSQALALHEDGALAGDTGQRDGTEMGQRGCGAGPKSPWVRGTVWRL